MIQKLSLLFYLLLISLNIFSLDNYDECSILKSKFIEFHSEYSLDEPISIQYMSLGSQFVSEYSSFRTLTGGLIFKKEFKDELNQTIYKRTLKGNLILEFYHPEILFQSEVKPKFDSEVFAINGINVNELSDYEITQVINRKYLDDGNISITIQTSDKKDEIFEFNLLDPWITGNGIENRVYEISNINSSDSTFDIRLREEIFWRQLGLNEIGREVMEGSGYSIEKLTQGLNKGVQPGFTCIFSIEEWTEMNMYVPNIFIQNSIDSEVISEEIVFGWSYDYFYKSDDSGEVIQDVSFYDINLNRESIHKLKSSFDYSAFPFDSQVFTIEYGANKIINYTPLIFSPFDTLMSQSVSDINIYEWNIVDFNISKSKTNYFDAEMSGHNINIISERQYFYYLIKIYLPILIVLSISLSVLFINPVQLESRLTVSVVCFLALIAYTYIIDNDVPKLSYLTIMDYAILISYFFAAVPLIQSIAAYSIGENDIDRSIKFNNNSKITIPILYLLCILVMAFMIVSSSDNVVGAFKL